MADTNIDELFSGLQSVVAYLMEATSHRDRESPDTYSCTEVFVRTDNRLLTISGAVFDVPGIRDEAFGVVVELGWKQFTVSDSPNMISIDWGETYYETPDLSGLIFYSSITHGDIKVEVENRVEELSDPYSDRVESVKVIKAIVIKSPLGTLFIGQNHFPHHIIVTTDPVKMEWY